MLVYFQSLGANFVQVFIEYDKRSTDHSLTQRFHCILNLRNNKIFVLNLVIPIKSNLMLFVVTLHPSRTIVNFLII